MPFQSEKQRRYLWANEPEIARDWTDRYGARGGGIMRVPLWRGGDAWNFIKDKSGYTQHNINNQLLRNALAEGRINENQYKRMGGYDVAQQLPGPAFTDVALVGGSSLGYNLAKSGFNIKDPTDINAQFGKYGPAESTELNVAGATGLNPSDLQMYEAIVGGHQEVGGMLPGGHLPGTNKEPISGKLNPLGEGIYSLVQGAKDIYSPSTAAAAEPDKIKAMRQDLKSVPAHMQRQTSFPTSTALQFSNLDNRSIQSQKYNDLVSRGIIQDEGLEGYSDWGYRDEEIGKGSKFYDPTHSRIQSILKPVRSTWNKYGKPVVSSIMGGIMGIPGAGLLMNSLRKDPYAANRIGMYGAYKDPSTGFMKDKFGYNVGTTLMKNRFLEPGSNSYRSYALDAMKGMEKAGKKGALNDYYQQTYGKTWDDVKKDHQQKNNPFGDPTLGGYSGSDAGFAASQPPGGNYGATGGNRSTGFGKSGFGRDPSDRMARGGIAGLWQR